MDPEKCICSLVSLLRSPFFISAVVGAGGPETADALGKLKAAAEVFTSASKLPQVQKFFNINCEFPVPEDDIVKISNITTHIQGITADLQRIYRRLERNKKLDANQAKDIGLLCVRLITLANSLRAWLLAITSTIAILKAMREMIAAIQDLREKVSELV